MTRRRGKGGSNKNKAAAGATNATAMAMTAAPTTTTTTTMATTAAAATTATTTNANELKRKEPDSPADPGLEPATKKEKNLPNLNKPHKTIREHLADYHLIWLQRAVKAAKFARAHASTALQRRAAKKALKGARKDRKTYRDNPAKVAKKAYKTAARAIAVMEAAMRHVEGDPPVDLACANTFKATVVARAQGADAINLLDLANSIQLKVAVAMALCTIDNIILKSAGTDPTLNDALDGADSTTGVDPSTLGDEVEVEVKVIGLHKLGENLYNDAVKLVDLHRFVLDYVAATPMVKPERVDVADIKALLRGSREWTKPVLVSDARTLGMEGVDSETTFRSLMKAVEDGTGIPVMCVVQDGETSSTTTVSWRALDQALRDRVRARPFNQLSAPLDGAVEYLKKFVPDVVWRNTMMRSGNHGVAGRQSVDAFGIITFQGAWADWHRDFGGSAVYYRVVQGSKRFFFAPSSDENVAWYQNKETNGWTVCSSKTPLADVVQFTVNAGECVFLPAGALHAVYTPTDATVVAGNMFHLAGGRKHVEVVEFEESLGTRELELATFPAVVATGLSAAVLKGATQSELNGFDALAEWLTDWVERSCENADLEDFKEKVAAAGTRGAKKQIVKAGLKAIRASYPQPEDDSESEDDSTLDNDDSDLEGAVELEGAADSA
ncbi:JmjC domain-containing histone demethylation protein 1 [Allomyces arbusculus]|nr:JmjC domain-containing histone demethylation protein 1 [Allomyces arbusculus]